MKELTPTQKLNSAIDILEKKQQREWQDVKNHFRKVTNELSPINLVKSTLEDLNQPEIKSQVIQAFFSISSGYLTRKIFIGKSKNDFKKLIGYILQYIMTNFISKKFNRN